jgi:DNA-binding transcriptional LysR family regulator
MPNWDDLRYVLALFRTGTLTGAAKELDVVRTTVGRRIRALERSMGVGLFTETPSGLVPTAAGEELARSAETLEAEVLGVTARLAGRDAELRGTLRVSTTDFVFECFSDVFADFLTTHPGIELSVLGTDEEVSLRRREADVAIRMRDAPPETLIGRKLGDVAFPIYGAPSLVDRVGQDAPLHAFPWLRFDARDDGRGLEPWYRARADGASTAMGFDSYQVMRRAVVAGIGVHFLPRFDAERLDLIALGDEPPPTRSLWMLTIPELRTNSRARAFLDHFAPALRSRLDS